MFFLDDLLFDIVLFVIDGLTLASFRFYEVYYKMGQKISSDGRSPIRQLAFIEPIISRNSSRTTNSTSLSNGHRSGRRSANDGTTTPKRHHSSRHHGHSYRFAQRHNRASASGCEPECPHRLDVLLDMPPVSESTQQKYGWNPDDKSVNVFVKDNDLIMHRHPVAQSTDGVRGKVGFSSGLHCWEVTWNTRQRGTHAVVGVASIDAPLTCVGYRSLIGQNDDSWGWDLGRNKLYHGGKLHREDKSGSCKTYPAYLDADENFVVPEKILVVLDMDEGTLSYVADGQFLGTAFSGLKGKTLYPVISCVWGHCEVGIKYINGLKRKFSKLHQNFIF